MRKRLFVQLNGGLGNQMFQYATARALSLNQDAELILDDWSGFARDFQYRRRYELGAFPIQARVALTFERIPIWLFRGLKRKNQTALLEKYFFGNFITETSFEFLSEINEIEINSNTWITGYWQSPLYFEKFKNLIQMELMPPPPKTKWFTELGSQIKNSDSVAIGIRLYEESNNPGAHSNDGKIKTIDEINNAIELQLTKYPNSKFYVFCTHRSSLFEKLKFPKDPVYITHDDGFKGTIERLWLLTQCRHHIFNNSSYYWWGAYLSEAIRGTEGQNIIASDNFINKDSIINNWKKF